MYVLKNLPQSPLDNLFNEAVVERSQEEKGIPGSLWRDKNYEICHLRNLECGVECSGECPQLLCSKGY